MNGDFNNDIHEFCFFIGSLIKNEWIPCHENKLKYIHESDKQQIFNLDIINTPKYLKQIKNNKYKQFKLKLINNDTSTKCICIKHIKLFGIKQ